MNEEKTVLLAEASLEQMRAFAMARLGMEFPGNTKEATMRSRISAAWEEDEIPVIEPEAPPPQTGAPPPPVEPEQQDPNRRRHARVLIQTDEDDDNHVQLAVNGKLMLVPRGEEADIPEEYLEVLQNAVTHRYQPLPDGGMDPVPRKVPLYPFQILRPLS